MSPCKADIQSEAELYEYVRSLPERYGCAILIVSHDLQWVMQELNALSV